MTLVDRLKRYAYIYLAVHLAVDIALAVRMALAVGSAAPSVAMMFACFVLATFLYSGVRNDEIPGRYGYRANVWIDPIPYWIGIGLLVVAHGLFTWIMTL